MPTYYVPTLAHDGKTVVEIIDAANGAGAIGEATRQGFRVSGVPTMAGASEPTEADPSPPTVHATTNPSRLSDAGLLLAWMGLLFPLLSLVGIVLGAVGGGRKGGQAVISGVVVLVVSGLLWALILTQH